MPVLRQEASTFKAKLVLLPSCLWSNHCFLLLACTTYCKTWRAGLALLPPCSISLPNLQAGRWSPAATYTTHPWRSRGSKSGRLYGEYFGGDAVLELREEGQQVALPLRLILAVERLKSALAWPCCRCTPGRLGMSVLGLHHGLPNGGSTASGGRL